MENLPGSLPGGLGCVSLGKFSQKIIKQETLSHETAEMVAQTSGKTQRPHRNGTCGVIQPALCTNFNLCGFQATCSDSALGAQVSAPTFW